MPVVALETERFSKLVGADKKKILDRLPYIGLDIESVETDKIRVEYSPNRPDFGTDYGIARALRGLLGIEIGLKRYQVHPSPIVVSVDPGLSKIRPFIDCAQLDGMRFDDEDIRQLISLQEDLHNGLGRKRRVVAIGLHAADSIVPPIQYRAAEPSFTFVPLGETKPMRLDEVLTKTDIWKTFGGILKDFKHLPILVDSKGTVLSFPPIINGNKTKVTARTKSIFVDVTSTDKAVGDDVLAIITTTLADMGGRISSVKIKYQDEARDTPDLSPAQVVLDERLVNQVTGLELGHEQIVSCLKRSRLDVSDGSVLIPRYRIDILHPVDIAEEVALGYGIDEIEPIYPPSKQPGVFNSLDSFLDKAADLVSESGAIELMTYELVGQDMLYGNFGRPSSGSIGVEGPRSVDHSLLRDSLIPSLMHVLSRNTKEQYPQRVFEIGRVYLRTDGGVREAWRLGCLIAHSASSFTEAKMYLEAFSTRLTGIRLVTKPGTHWSFAEGRTADVLIEGKSIGHVGEVKPSAVAAFGLDVPVAGYEIDLEFFRQN